MPNTTLHEIVPGGDLPILDLASAPMPTEKTLKGRRSIAFQFTRFLSFNSRIMRMVVKGHS